MSVSAPAYLYDTQVRHVRTTPLRHSFGYGGYSWLVDLDHLPRLPWGLGALARFEARDHLGDPSRTLRQNVDAFLASRGIDLGGGRVLMLAQARTLGHVFNPLSVFWCYDWSGQLVCTLAEVHNTYGERHCYLVRTDPAGRATADKALYVSPFNPVEGSYHLSLPEPGETLSLTVTLHRPDQRPFVATLRGRRLPARVGTVLRLAMLHPLATRVVSARIRVQGIRLWARRLPVAARPAHEPQPGVQAPAAPPPPPTDLPATHSDTQTRQTA